MKDTQPKTSSNLVERPISSVAEDRLGFDSYITALSEYISNAETPTTIAIQGDWGTGKTSFMNAIRSKLCVSSIDLYEAANDEKTHSISATLSDSTQTSTHYYDKPFYAISLNVWEHTMLRSSDEAVVLIIKSILTEIQSFLPSTSEHERKKIEELITASSVQIGVSSVASILWMLYSGEPDPSLTAKLCSLFKKLKDLKQLFSKNKSHTDKNEDLFMPAKFKQEISTIIQACLQSNDGMNRKGFVIFIDDLDRIEPESAVRILDMLKNFFDVDHCIFVLAIDQNVAIKGLQAKFGNPDEFNKDTFQSFFDKIIQVTFHMPMAYYNLFNYINEALTHIGYISLEDLMEYEAAIPLLGRFERYDKLLIEFTRLSVGTNPRTIKRLICNLSLIKHVYASMHIKSDDIDQKLAVEKLLIYTFVCIQISYPQVFELLSRSPIFINWLEETASSFGCKDYKKYYRPDWVDNNLLNNYAEELSTNTYPEVYQAIIASFCHTSNSESLKKHVSDIAKLLRLIEELCNYTKPISNTRTYYIPNTETNYRYDILKALLQVSSATAESHHDMNNDSDANDYENSHLIKRFWHDLLLYGHMTTDYLKSDQSYIIDSNLELSIPLKIEIDGITKTRCTFHLKVLEQTTQHDMRKVLVQPTRLDVLVEFSTKKDSPFHASDHHIATYDEEYLDSWNSISGTDDSNLEKLQKTFYIDLSKPLKWRAFFDELILFMTELRREIPIIHQTYHDQLS